MRGLVIGAGAAGNKAAIELLQRGYIAPEDLLLVNSTLKDIPEEFRGYAVQLSLEHDGCGKERSLAKQITLKALQTRHLNLQKYVIPEHKKIIIVSSVEGGTGSGSLPILASYCKKILGLPVECIGFMGFETDTRALQNTIEWFQDMESDYGIQTICNKKFLKEANSNTLKAEKLANDEFCRRVRLSLGLMIEESEQNIDAADIYKISNTVGYTDIVYASVNERIKSVEQFNSIVKVSMDETKSIDIETPSATRLGIIINLHPASQEFVDYSWRSIKERYGTHMYEIFPHVQYDQNQEEFIGLIVSGMKLPVDEVKGIFDKYQKESEALDAIINKDTLSEIRSLQGNYKDDQFNMLKNTDPISSCSEDDFFRMFSNHRNDEVKKAPVQKKPSKKDESEF